MRRENFYLTWIIISKSLIGRGPEGLGKYRNESLNLRLFTQPAASRLNILSGILVAPLKWLGKARAETAEWEKLTRD